MQFREGGNLYEDKKKKKRAFSYYNRMQQTYR